MVTHPLFLHIHLRFASENIFCPWEDHMRSIPRPNSQVALFADVLQEVALAASEIQHSSWTRAWAPHPRAPPSGRSASFARAPGRAQGQRAPCGMTDLCTLCPSLLPLRPDSARPSDSLYHHKIKTWPCTPCPLGQSCLWQLCH